MTDQQKPPIIDPVQEARVIEAWKEYSGYSRPAPFVSRDHEVSFEAFSQGFKRGQQDERNKIAALIDALEAISHDGEACYAMRPETFALMDAALREVRRD